MKSLTMLFALPFAICLFTACNAKQQDASATSQDADTTTSQSAIVEPGLVINHFGTDSTGVDSIWLVDGDIIILGKSVHAGSGKNRLNEDEVECLKKCKKTDGSYDLDCILKCPVSKRFSFSIPAWKTAQ